MKKIIYFIIIIIVLIIAFLCIYTNFKIKFNMAQRENLDFEYYYQKEINGLDIATIINKVVDNNEKNEISKDKNNLYISNEEDSIIIEIYMKDNETVYRMETLYKGGINRFVQNYRDVKFKCTKKDYHKSTNRISYLYFEQITE